ncbi:MAG: TonB-dependent receptor [Verrucomicrobia bacterium]|nr:TonB-dependent receptor [Verrucomicrobiota bacterium]
MHHLTMRVARPTLRAFRARPAATVAVLSFLTSAAFAPLFAQSASASTAKKDSEEVVKMEAVVTAGTRFNPRTVTESIVPIDVLTNVDLNLGGYTEPAQMLQSLVPSFNFPRATIGDGTDHIRPATLRGLAPDQTLLLVNGKRRHTSALVNVNGFVGRGSVSIDLNAIPGSAIGRVEVLRDGASAQYGSDAIAGVLNVVLDRTMGYGFSGTYGFTKEGDGIVREAAAYYGAPLAKDGFIFTSVFTRNRGGTNRSQPDTRQQYFGRNATTGALTTASGNLGSGIGASASNGTLDAREAGFARKNHWQGDSMTQDNGLFVNAELPLDGGIVGYAFGGYTKRDGKSAGFFRRAADDRTVRAIYPNGFLPKINSDITDKSIGAGLKGKAGGWNWDASTLWGGNEFEFTITDTANVTLGAASPTRFYAGLLKFGEWVNNLDLTNSFNVGWRAPLKVALGAEYRKDNYQIKAGEPDSYRDGGVRILDGPNTGNLGAPGAQVFPGFRPSDATDKNRDNVALYLDVENDLAENFTGSLAARFEDYSDFGSKATVKGSGRLAFSKEAALRGSVSTGFRSPHLAQQWFSSTATNFIGGVPFDNKTFPVTDPVAKLMGATRLKPETSTNYSIGTTYAAKGFSAALDFYQVEIKDRIVLSSTFIDSGTTLIKDFLARNGQPQAVGGRFFTNAVDTRTQGVDLDLHYAIKTDSLGKVTLNLGANRNVTKVTRAADTPAALKALTLVPLFDVTEKVRMEKGQPRDAINFAINWEPTKKLATNLRFVRYGEVTGAATTNSGWSQAQINAVTPGFKVAFEPAVPSINAAGLPVATANQQVLQTFDAKWVTDLDVTYKVTKGISVSVGANNLFNTYPTKNVASTTAFGGNDNVGIFPYSGISPFGFNGAFYYSKVSLRF